MAFGNGRGTMLLVAGCLLGLQTGGHTEVGGGARSRETRARIEPEAATASPPLPWEPNAGQAPASVLAVGRGGGATVLVERGGARLLVPGGAVSMEFRGAGGGPAAFGRRLAGVSNYFLGSDPEGWIRRVPHHASTVVEGAPGSASVTWTSRGGLPACDFVLPPGFDPATVEIRFTGAGPLSVGADGALSFSAGDGVLHHSPPVAWQDVEGGRVPVAARWVLRGPGRAGFGIGGHDPRRPLVIDPEVRFVRLLGGSGMESALKAAFDGEGRLLLAGATASTDFPLEAPLQGTHGGGQTDAFVTVMDPDSGAIAWSTFLGGARTDAATAVAADGAGIVVAGNTASSDFPTANALDPSLQFSDAQAVGAGVWEDGFVARLTPEGDALPWSTYIGGDRDRDFIQGLGIAPDGSIRICGGTAGFTETITAPLILGATTTLGAPKWQAFWVASLPADGSAFQWLLAVGYASAYSLSGLAVTPDGDALVVGSSWGNTWVENALQPTAASANYEGWIARVKADGTGVRWATFLGGTGAEMQLSVATDAAGAAYVAGTTDSPDFPVTAGAIQPARAGNSDLFVAKISPDGSALEYSTYLGGSLGEGSGAAIAVDPDGVVVLVGQTGSADFPEAAAPPGLAGTGADAFVARVSPDGTRLLHSFRWGASDFDSGVAAALRGKGVLVGGWSRSPELPGTTAVPTAGGDFVLLEFDPRPSPVLDLRASMAGPAAVRLEWSLTAADAEEFRIERRVDGSPWAELATVPAGTLSHHDADVEAERRYTYRVFAVRSVDESIPSNEASIDTVPPAPAGLVAIVVNSRRVDLSWTDLSEGEAGFELERVDGDGNVVQAALTAAGAVFHSDTTVLPDRSYTYRVRAFHLFAASGWSNDATAATPATLDVRIRRGNIVLSHRADRDRAVVHGGFEPLPSGEGGFDPREAGLRLIAGGWSGAAIAEVPPLDGAWRVRGSRYTWTSPRGPGPRVRVRLDTIAGTFSTRVRRASLVPEPGTPLRLSLAAGESQRARSARGGRRGRRRRPGGGVSPAPAGGRAPPAAGCAAKRRLREFRDLPLELRLGDPPRLQIGVELLDGGDGGLLPGVHLHAAGLVLLPPLPVCLPEGVAEGGDLRLPPRREVLVGHLPQGPGGAETRRGAEGAPEDGDELGDAGDREAGAGAEAEPVEEGLGGPVVHGVAPVLAHVPDQFQLEPHDGQIRRDGDAGHREGPEDGREDRVLEDVLPDLGGAPVGIGDGADAAREDGVLCLPEDPAEEGRPVLRDPEPLAHAVEGLQLLRGRVAVGVGEGVGGVVDRVPDVGVGDPPDLRPEVDGLGEHPVEGDTLGEPDLREGLLQGLPLLRGDPAVGLGDGDEHP